MAKQTKSRASKSKGKNTNPKYEPTVIVGGHRDLAEKLSQDYYFFTSKLNWEQLPDMLDMDVLTDLLQQFEPELLEEMLNDPWSQGFVMGMLHQLCLTANVLKEDLDNSQE